MMNISKVGKRYAKALFSFALVQNESEKVMDDMNLVHNTIEQSRELQLLLKNPLLHSKKKKTIIKAIFESHVGKTVLTYLMIIVQKDRETYIRDIAMQFVVLYKEYYNIKTAYLSTAGQVDDVIRQTIVQTLKEQLNADIELVEELQQELIGGIILKVDDQEIDMSLKKRLNELSREFQFNLYEGKF